MQPIRQRVAQENPAEGVDLTRFPQAQMRDVTLYRAQKAGYPSPEHYASGADGRFNLESPRGTWYLADDAEAAIFEYLGLDGYPYRVVPRGTADQFELWTLIAITRQRLADLKDRHAARFGVTSELGVMTPYDVPRQWATAFDDHGFEGVQYEPRFTPGCVAVALFGDVDGDSHPSVRKTSGREACELAGIQILETPIEAELDIVQTPAADS
ncbi:RES family NAD+ phosphorylase [Agromyces sp. H66]|uniref:RES family NAD+ phosphorylase n=1 Tax=Agromyces sp. H66 TaxID=2529859 RepID=UPI0020BFA40C|nr:RES family NAD+ phosphorylase [Agromyces sp. H66]